MRANIIRNLLDQGKPTLATHIHTVWPNIVEVLGHTGLYDYVEFVAEYGTYTLHDLDNICRAAELHNLGTMIKIDWANNEYVAQRAVGSGFNSVLYSDVRSAAGARDCVRYVRADSPQTGGTFGVATRRFSYMRYGGSEAYVQALNNVVVALMLEKKPALDELDEILAVDGVEMLQWGPSDFSMSIGVGGQRQNPQVQAGEKRVIESCLAAGVIPRIEISSADEAKHYLDMGARHFCIGTEIAILYQFWQKEGEQMRRALDE
jgi:4-hydroxy-2-oxoheptanedioate aldolase